MVAPTVKDLPVMQETWVQSLGRVDPLEKEMACQYSCLKNLMDRERSLAGYSPQDLKEILSLMYVLICEMHTYLPASTL